MSERFYCGVIEMFNSVNVAQHCEFIKCHFEIVTCVLYDLHLKLLQSHLHSKRYSITISIKNGLQIDNCKMGIEMTPWAEVKLQEWQVHVNNDSDWIETHRWFGKTNSIMTFCFKSVDDWFLLLSLIFIVGVFKFILGGGIGDIVFL